MAAERVMRGPGPGPAGAGLAGTAVLAVRGLAVLALALALAGCGSATVTHAATVTHVASDTHAATPHTVDPAAAAIPAALVRESRPIGHGPAFDPAATGPVLGACRPALGRRVGVHVEVFGANRVVLVAAGIGVRPPLRWSAGRITRAGCFGALVTLEPTGVVLVAPGARLTVSDLFRSWGQPLSADRLASFQGRVRVYVGGRPRAGPAAAVPLRPHAEIVLEVGPYVPPHSSYNFPPGS